MSTHDIAALADQYGEITAQIKGLELKQKAIREAILDPDKTSLIHDLIESGVTQYGMQTFDQSIMRWYRQNVISYETAIANATRPPML